MSNQFSRLSQSFSVNGSYIPTKVSLYLKKVGYNVNKYFDISEDVSIDASNFSSIEENGNYVIFSDTDADFTGNGYLSVIENTSVSELFDYAVYPIKTSTPDGYNLWLRIKNPNATTNIDILIDENVVNTFSQVSATTDWTWIELSFIIPDTDTHHLGIQMKDIGSFLDKLYISDSSSTPSGYGPDLTESPFTTVHVQMYETVDYLPTNPLLIYDYKTTLDSIIVDDWYNFDTRSIDGSVIVFSGDNSIVLSASGGSNKNYVIWEMVDSDEYDFLPSAIKVG